MLDYSSRADAINELLIGLFGGAIALAAVRRGERWGWYVMWLWPPWIVAHVLNLRSAATHPATSTPVSFLSGSIFLVLCLLALAASYGLAFPR
jgi:hypothetical protein